MLNNRGIHSYTVTQFCCQLARDNIRYEFTFIDLLIELRTKTNYNDTFFSCMYIIVIDLNNFHWDFHATSSIVGMYVTYFLIRVEVNYNFI